MSSFLMHPDYNSESKRVQETVTYIGQYILEIGRKQQLSAEGIKDAFVNLDGMDSSQSYITILVNARYLENSRESLDKAVRAKDRPYFSRIDFQDKRDPKPTRYYLGKISLWKNNDEPLIIDWRAPIASVYYDGTIGEVEYRAEEGAIQGELFLKRKYTIENGELLDFFDLDITTSDELLQNTLRGSADDRLKDIVATIQAEQNKIIRAPLEKPLIVQGVAGSGKTTIALHRIAYLIYTYEKTFEPENFMIIAPNKLFLNYISDVLPELGVEEARQTTFEELCLQLLNTKDTVLGREHKLVRLLDANNSDSDLLRWASAFKGSMGFKELIDNYIAHLEQELLPKEDMRLAGQLIISAEELAEAFLRELRYLPINKRLAKLKKRIALITKQKKFELLDWLDRDYQDKIDAARVVLPGGDEEASREKAVALAEQRNAIMADIEKKARILPGIFIKQFKKHSAISCYKEMVVNAETLQRYAVSPIDSAKIEYLSQTSKECFKAKIIEPEDLAPLLYLKARIEGFVDKVTCRYVVIDEAQDFSLFQFYTLKYVFGTQSFTLLGDLSQGIHSYRGVHNWQEVNQVIFSNAATTLSLRQSYRTTAEIMTLANDVLHQGLPGAVLAEPVVRQGSQPDVRTFCSVDELVVHTVQQIAKLRLDGCSTIALIGKTLAECRLLQGLLAEDGYQITILTGEEEDYHGGLLIVPAYAAKGLEFDAVIILCVEEKFVINELDTKLLYVAMTRAMHQLAIYTIEDKVAFF